MKNCKLIILSLVITTAFAVNGFTQNGVIEAVDGVIIGDNSGTMDGTIRYTGADFEGRKAGIWTSLTGAGASMWDQNGSKIYYSSDNVGIGTNNPQVEFHIEGASEMLRLAGTSPWFSLRQTGNSEYAYNWFTSDVFTFGVTGPNKISFTTDGSTRMRISETGDIGIGTTAPAAKVHIKHDGEGLRIDGNIPYIKFYTDATHKGGIFHNAGEMNFSNQLDDKMNFRTGGTKRMTIDELGNVGIGISTPAATLDVRGDAIFNEGGLDKDFRIESDFETHAVFVEGSSGYVGINTDDPNAPLHVGGTVIIGSVESIEDGGSSELRVKATWRPNLPDEYDLGTSSHKWVNVWAVNGTIQTSDRRLKKDIKKLNYGMDEIMKLKPVKFKWKDSDDGDVKLGLIAQEVLPVISEVVKTHHYESSEVPGEAKKRVENERMGVYYSDLIPVLIKGMQEQQEQINSLEKEIEKLKSGK